MATAPSGRRYIGITTQGMTKRWRDHCKEARRGVRTHLNYAILKYGGDAFDVRPLVWASWEELNRLEPLAIVAYGTRSPEGYNLREGGSQSSPHPESVEKQAAKLRGRKWSEERKAEHCRVMSSPDVREKLSASHKGNRPSEATKAKMRVAHADNGGRAYSDGMLGKSHSEETRAKMRRAHAGRPPMSEETRKKISESQKKRHAARKSQ